VQKFVAHENKTRHLPRLASYWLRPWLSGWLVEISADLREAVAH